MNEFAPRLAVIVLGDPGTRVGGFVERNLRTAHVAAHFADSTERLEILSAEIDASRLVLIEPDWDLMLRLTSPRPCLFVVWWRGDAWTPPWEDAGFEVRDPHRDDALFRRHLLAWLRED